MNARARARFRQERGFILARAPAGESHLGLTLLSPESGELRCYLRPPKKGAQAAPDIFAFIEATLEKSRRGSGHFVREHRVLRGHPGIARNFAALQAACALTGTIRKNLRHTERFEPVCALLEQALSGFEKNIRPDACLLKSLYLYARQEGYPVKEQFASALPAPEAGALTAILKEPLDKQTTAPDAVSRLQLRLETWLRHETDIFID